MQLFIILINLNEFFFSIEQSVQHTHQHSGQTDMAQRPDHLGGCRQTQRQARQNRHCGKDPPLHSGTEVRPSGSGIPKSKYRLVIGNATWSHTVLTNPGAYSADAFNSGNAAATRKQFMVQHKIKQKSYRDYLNVEEAGKELILYTISNKAVAPLKKQYIGFGNTTALAMINHLRLKTRIRMTTAQKYEYKMNGYNTPWDFTTSITVCFTLLNRFQVLLGDRRIATSIKEKTIAAGAQMCQLEMFIEDQMVVWENRGAMAQTWAALQSKFTEKWLEQKQYLATTAKQS
jgi:hypothetical protein